MAQLKQISTTKNIDKNLVDEKIKRQYHTRHPQIHKLMIPTPKTSMSNSNQHNATSWKDNESIAWEYSDGKQNIQDVIPRKTDEELLMEKMGG